MKLQKHLLNKNAIAIIALSKEFLNTSRGTKITTIATFCEHLEVARGTIQNSIKLLQNEGAIKLEVKGHLGTFLVDKDIKKLLSFACISSIVGCMPLPYSKRYEGFASGLIVAMENEYNLLASMAYMRGAKNRIAMVIAGRYDYAVISKYAALQSIQEKQGIEIIKTFGPNSYLSEHVILFHNPTATQIQDGMKIGVDFDSIDQKQLTEIVCKGKNIEFIQIEYSKVVQRVLDGTIDAAVWNKDEITDKFIDITFSPIKAINEDYAEAVIVVSEQRPELKALLNEIMDTKVIMNVQQMVLDGKITPSY